MVVFDEDIYTDLDTLPIFNFYKCVEGELNYLYLSKVGKETKELVRKWEHIYDSYCEIEKNPKRASRYRLIGEIEGLKVKRNIVPSLLRIILNTRKNEEFRKALEELKRWGVPLNVKGDLIQQSEKVLKSLNNSARKIKRKEEYLVNLSKNTDSGSHLNIYEMAISINRSLGVKPDIYKDSVKQWLSYLSLIKKQGNV